MSCNNKSISFKDISGLSYYNLDSMINWRWTCVKMLRDTRVTFGLIVSNDVETAYRTRRRWGHHGVRTTTWTWMSLKPRRRRWRSGGSTTHRSGSAGPGGDSEQLQKPQQSLSSPEAALPVHTVIRLLIRLQDVYTGAVQVQDKPGHSGRSGRQRGASSPGLKDQNHWKPAKHTSC